MSSSIASGNLPSIVNLPTSKSYANRALILAALKPQTVILENVPTADDVVFLIKALKDIGLDVYLENSRVEIKNNFPDCEQKDEVHLEVGEGGTTARFLASMLILGKSKYVLHLGKRLKDRPWDEFIRLATDLGAFCKLEDNKLSIQGPAILPAKIEVDCSLTTQFASGLQLACAFKKVEIVPLNLNSSQSYWKMSQELIEFFLENRMYTVPLDWSSASYPMAFAALKHEIFFPKLKRDTFQADEKFCDLLHQFSCVKVEESGIRVKKIENQSQNIEMDVSDCLDLVPTLAFFLTHIDGTHRLMNLKNLVHKESDRLYEVFRIMKEFGFEARMTENELIIEGTQQLPSRFVDMKVPEDHRLVMMASLFMRYHQGGKISPDEAVNKSYPNFFKLFK